jgi:S-adenosylmethionine:tRNA ribosyltransferase-isomerase
LPDELIAQTPLERRESSRMLIATEAGILLRTTISIFSAIFENGDVLVLNNTRVFPARLHGETETGANVELFLVRNMKIRHGKRSLNRRSD